MERGLHRAADSWNLWPAPIPTTACWIPTTPICLAASCCRCGRVSTTEPTYLIADIEERRTPALQVDIERPLWSASTP